MAELSLFGSSAPSAEGSPARRLPWATCWGGVLVVVVTVATFLPVLSSDFVYWDDIDNFLTNPYYRGLGWTNLRWMFTTAHTGHYIPITWLTLGLDYLLWGMNPRGYHLTSLMLHAVNALLFYLVARRLLRAALGWPRSAAGLTWGATAAALFFAVHPLRVESVAWISERRDVVSGVLTCLTVLAYLKGWEGGESGRLRRGWYWTAVGLFGLALLSKSIVVGLPVVLLALDYYPLRRASLALTGWWRLVTEKVPFVVLSFAVGVPMLVMGLRQGLMTRLDRLGLTDRVAVSAYGLVFYLWKTAIPWPLSPLYELHLPIRPLAPMYLIPSAVVLTISAVAVVARRRWPAALTAWLSYVTLLLPVVGVFHNGYQVTADRYSYLACLGWALLAGGGIVWCWDAKRRGLITSRLAALVLALTVTATVGLAGLSTLQIRVWHNSETLWRHAFAVDPRSALAHYHFGNWLTWIGRLSEARTQYEEALALVRRPDVKAAALNNLGIAQAQLGELESAHESFQRALRVLPDYREACDNLWNLARMIPVDSEELRRCRETAPGNGVPVRPLPGH